MPSRHDRVFAVLDAHHAERWPLFPELDTLAGAVGDAQVAHHRDHLVQRDGHRYMT
ncbi:MAG TPA: hypothetical protein VN969_05095 [Streptosporangiaceae bacterium]|nr:hypothetical protein [Streptosporangiaceae bacterium]